LCKGAAIDDGAAAETLEASICRAYVAAKDVASKNVMPLNSQTFFLFLDKKKLTIKKKKIK
jgi:hypothetical protein